MTILFFIFFTWLLIFCSFSFCYEVYIIHLGKTYSEVFINYNAIAIWDISGFPDFTFSLLSKIWPNWARTAAMLIQKWVFFPACYSNVYFHL